MRFVFDLASCVAEERDGKLVVHTEPEDENSWDHAVYYLRRAFHHGSDELRGKAAAAIAMSASPQAAAEWLQECEEAHIPGDCPLCGAT